MKKIYIFTIISTFLTTNFFNSSKDCKTLLVGYSLATPVLIFHLEIDGAHTKQYVKYNIECMHLNEA